MPSLFRFCQLHVSNMISSFANVVVMYKGLFVRLKLMQSNYLSAPHTWDTCFSGAYSMPEWHTAIVQMQWCETPL